MRTSDLIDVGTFFAARAKEHYLMATFPKKYVTEKDDVVNIEIPDSAKIVMNPRERRYIERETNLNFRWPAGGCGIIVHCANASFLVLIRKDSGSPSYAGHDTIGAGLGSSAKEWLYPLATAIREGIEEVMIKAGNRVICPIFERDFSGFGYDIFEIVKQNRGLYKESQECKIVSVPTNFKYFEDFGKTVIVNFNGQKSPMFKNVLVNIDHGCGGIDIMCAIELELKESLEDITIFDGEEISGKPLNRIMNAYEMINGRITGSIICSWQGGKKIETQPNAPFVPHTKQLMDVLSRLKIV